MEGHQENVDAVHRAMIAMAEGKLDAVVEQLEEDAKWRRSPLLADGGTYDGRGAIRTMMTNVRERMGGRPHVLELTVYGAGEHVFAEYTLSPSSDPLEEGSEHVLAAFSVVLGKIREAREFVFERR
jgi:ketosteroid isomerase-like protein